MSHTYPCTIHVCPYPLTKIFSKWYCKFLIWRTFIHTTRNTVHSISISYDFLTELFWFERNILIPYIDSWRFVPFMSKLHLKNHIVDFDIQIKKNIEINDILFQTKVSIYPSNQIFNNEWTSSLQWIRWVKLDEYQRKKEPDRHKFKKLN